jgi:hypothetical protein
MIYSKKFLLFIVLLPTFIFATPKNIFIIKDKDGKVLKGKRISHKENSFLEKQAKLIKEMEKLENKKRVAKFTEEQKKLFSQIDELKKVRIKGGYYDKTNILLNAKKYLGGKYVWGGTLPNGFDCSGYVQYVYKKEGVQLPRTAFQQSKVGKDVTWQTLQEGDLLFFLTDKSRNIPVTHVGLYLGEDKFIHAASSKKGIIISSLSKSRYAKLFVKATRIIK